jgi:hypothetical protein
MKSNVGDGIVSSGKEIFFSSFESSPFHDNVLQCITHTRDQVNEESAI